MSKKYTTNFLEDTNGSTGSANQVLISTPSGIDWVDGSGSSIIGGPYLPLSAGASYPLTGRLDLISTGGTGIRIVTGDTSEGYLIFGDAADNSMGGIAYNNNTNTLSIDCNNQERITINSSGNVGIGTTSPSQKLHVAGGTIIDASTSGQTLLLGRSNGQPSIKAQTDNGGHLILDSATNFMSLNHYVNENIVMVAGGGNVGIGTTSPGAKLDVVGEGAAIGSTGYYYNARFKDSDNVGVLIGHNNTSNGNGMIAGINKLAFLTYGTSWGERMIIDGNGNVGIGTTSPNALLEISGIRENQIRLTSYDTTAAADEIIGGIEFYSSDAGNEGIKAKISAFSTDATGSAYLSFFTGTGQEQMRISNAGSLKLDAYGAGTLVSDASGNITVSSGGGAGGPYLPLAGGTMTGQLTFPYGFLGDYIYHTGDSNTYFGFSSSDTFSLFTGGSNRLHVNSAGNVGIGTTSPNRKLTVIGGSSDDIIARFKATGTGTGNYSEIHIINDNDDKLVLGSIGSNYAGSTWAGMRYMYSAAGDLGLKATSSSGNVRIYAGGAGSERMRITSDGNVGIGTTNPGARLVVNSSNLDDTNTLKINHTRNDANVATRAVEVDMNLSGADTTTTDRNNYGIFVDLDSSADGDDTHEHRIHGVGSDVRFTGFSDLVRGAYFYVESNNNTEKTTVITGVEGKAIHDSNSTNGGVTSMYGVRGNAIPQNLGDVDNAYGGCFTVDLTNNRGSADFGVSKGVEGHINIDKDSTVSYGAMTAVSGIIDNNEGTVPNFGNQYLFKGDYQGTKGSNAWGIYVEGDKHFFDGNVGIGTTSPTAPLTIANANGGNWNDGLIIDDASGWAATVYKRNNVPKMFNGLYSGNDNYIWMSAGYSNSGTTITAPRADAVLMARPETDDLQIYLDTHFGGNVGIGTTDPSSLLHIKGADPILTIQDTSTSTSNASSTLRLGESGVGGVLDVYWDIKQASDNLNTHLEINHSSNGNHFTILDNGNVGIGTTSPGDKLEVSGNVYAHAFNSTGTLSRYNGSGGIAISGLAGNAYAFISAYSNSGGAGKNLSLQKDGGNVGIGTTSPVEKLHVEGNVLINGAAPYVSIKTTQTGTPDWKIYNSYNSVGDFAIVGGSSGGNKFNIQPNGNVGIGTTSPDTLLQTTNTADGTDYISYEIGNTAVNAGNKGGFAIYELGTKQVTLEYYRDGSAITNLSTPYIFTIDTNSQERMRINSSGNVGIGTTSPSQRAVISGPNTSPSLNTTAVSNASLLISNSDTGYGTYFASTGGGIGLIQQRRQTSAVYYDLALQPYGGNVGIGTTSINNFGFLETVLNISAGSSSSTTLQQAGIVISGSSDADDADDFGYLSFTNYQSAITNDRVAEIRALKNGTNVDTGEFAFYTSSGSGPTERMRITSTGNVGIGTTSPDAKLHVDGTAIFDTQTGAQPFYITRDGVANQALKIYVDDAAAVFESIQDETADNYGSFIFKMDDGTTHPYFDIRKGNSTLARFDGSGNVGIGTTSPSRKLSIENGGFDMFAAGGTSVDAFSVVTHNYVFSDENEDAVYSYANSEHEFSTQGFPRVNIDSVGLVGIGTTSPSSLLHVSGGELDVSGGDGYKIEDNPWAYWASDLLTLGDWDGVGYATRIMGSNSSEVMRVTGTNVGIGTTDPGTKLDVVASTTGKTWADYAGTVGTFERNGDSNINIISSNTGVGGVWFGDTDSMVRGRIRYEHASDRMELWTNNSEKVSITSGGNVGIGTTSPSYKLDVDGEVRVGDNQKLKLWDNAFSAIITPLDAHLALTTTRAQDNIYFDPGNSTKVVMEAGGNVGIGVTSPTSRFHVKQTLASPSVPMAYFEADRGPSAYGATNVRVDNLDYGYGMKFYRSGTYDSSAVGFINGSSTVGSISIGTSSTSYNTTSDYRLKENVTSITDGITRIKQLEPKRFNFIGQTDIVDGFLAHEAKQVVPEAVTGEKDEVLPNGDPLYQGIDQAKLVPLLTAALQEAVAKIENLENRIQILENN